MNKHSAKILIFLYFVGYLILFPVMEIGILKISDSEHVLKLMNLFEWLFYLFFPMVMISFVKPWLKKEVYLFLHHPFKNFLNIIKNYGLMMLTSILVNMLLLLVFGLENSGNQNQLINLYAVQPVKVLYASLVFAPIVEELVFRGALYAPLRKQHHLAAVVFSSFMFGLLHVYQSLFSGNFKDLLYILSYGLLGSFMCKTYDETNSFTSSMLLHFLNNAISVVLTFIIF